MRANFPLRYPGGKGKMYKKTSRLIREMGMENVCYIEPYAGGAGLALELLFNNDVKRIVLNDFDINYSAQNHKIGSELLIYNQFQLGVSDSKVKSIFT